MIQAYGWAIHPDLTELDGSHANTCQKVEKNDEQQEENSNEKSDETGDCIIVPCHDAGIHAGEMLIWILSKSLRSLRRRRRRYWENTI